MAEILTGMNALKVVYTEIQKAMDMQDKIEMMVDTEEYTKYKSQLIQDELDGKIHQGQLVDNAFLTGAYTAIRLYGIAEMQSKGVPDANMFIHNGCIAALENKTSTNEEETDAAES